MHGGILVMGILSSKMTLSSMRLEATTNSLMHHIVADKVGKILLIMHTIKLHKYLNNDALSFLGPINLILTELSRIVG